MQVIMVATVYIAWCNVLFSHQGNNLLNTYVNLNRKIL